MDNSKTQLTINTRLWVVALLLTTAIGSAFYWYDDAEIINITAIQFSSTMEDFIAKISRLSTLKIHTYLDFIFIISYSLLFYAAYRVFQTSMRIKLSKMFVFICFLPGVFDMIENILFLSLTDNIDITSSFTWYWAMVRAKWSLVIPFFLINITILIYYVVKVINHLIKPNEASKKNK